MSLYKSGNHVYNCLTTLPSPTFLVIKIIKSAEICVTLLRFMINYRRSLSKIKLKPAWFAQACILNKVKVKKL